MVASRPSGSRFVLAATLMLILALTGVGRGFVAMASEASHSLAGVTVPICHSGPGEASIPSDPAHPVQHDCCDACALLAPTVLPAAPVLTTPTAVEHHAAHAAAIAWSPHLARLRGPRLSRGPPSA